VKIRVCFLPLLGLDTGTARPRRPEALSLHPRVRSERKIGQCGREAVHQSTPSPRKARLSASLTACCRRRVCPRACGALRYREKRALASAFYSVVADRFRFGILPAPARGIASPSPQNMSWHTDGSRLLQGIDGLTKPPCVEGGSRFVAGARLNRRWHLTSYFRDTIACRAARVVQAVGCSGWVIRDKFGDVRATSAFAPKADIHTKLWHVSKVPGPRPLGNSR